MSKVALPFKSISTATSSVTVERNAPAIGLPVNDEPEKNKMISTEPELAEYEHVYSTWDRVKNHGNVGYDDLRVGDYVPGVGFLLTKQRSTPDVITMTFREFGGTERVATLVGMGSSSFYAGVRRGSRYIIFEDDEIL